MRRRDVSCNSVSPYAAREKGANDSKGLIPDRDDFAQVPENPFETSPSPLPPPPILPIPFLFEFLSRDEPAQSVLVTIIHPPLRFLAEDSRRKGKIAPLPLEGICFVRKGICTIFQLISFQRKNVYKWCTCCRVGSKDLRPPVGTGVE